MTVDKRDPCTQDIQGTHQKEIQDIDRNFMGFISPDFQGKPLNRMEYRQKQAKKQVVNRAEHIPQEFIHGAKVIELKQIALAFHHFYLQDGCYT